MSENMLQEAIQEAARKCKWDAFLDAYSDYMRQQSARNAISLKIAGNDLEQVDDTFSFHRIERRMGGQACCA